MGKTTAGAPAARPFSKAAIAVFAALTAVGVGFWIYQLVKGHQVTGMTNESYGGANIILFMFFVGLSAGGLIVASSAHVFNIERFKKVALPAVVVSTVSICLAAGFILVDLGSIQRIFQMIMTPNVISPLVWDMTVIALYLVINILDIVWIRKGDERKVKVLSYVALPVAVLVHSVTAWIFSLQIGHMWYTAIMAPIFVVSALDSGMALLILGLMLLEARGLFVTGKPLFKSLSGLLAVFIAVDAYLIGCEVLTMGYPGAGEAMTLSVMTTGAMAPFFWFEIVFGLVIPFLILVVAKNREKKGLVAAACILVVLGVLCKRVWLLLTAFIAPYAGGSPIVPSEAMATDALSFGAAASFYAPTAIEMVIVVGVLSLGVLAFMVLSNLLMGKSTKVQAPETTR